MQLVLKPEEIAHPNGLEITVKGFKGDVADAIPSQVWIEVYDGKLRVHVWDGAQDAASSIDIEPL